MKVFVRQPCRLTAVVVWSATIAALAGVLLSITFVRPGLFILALVPSPLNEWLGTIVSLGLPIPLALWFARRCQRSSHVYLAGHLFCGCYVLAFAFATSGLAPGAWVSVGVVWLAGLLVLAMAVGAIGGFANILLRTLNRRLLFQVLEQDGTLCRACGYQIGKPPLSSRCPECGVPVGASLVRG